MMASLKTVLNPSQHRTSAVIAKSGAHLDADALALAAGRRAGPVHVDPPAVLLRGVVALHQLPELFGGQFLRAGVALKQKLYRVGPNCGPILGH